ncbi:hypothetical protein UFOVP53_189 [uncultured Caudovirales phage]|uniref:Uncharacterized protein n=1 Tax=uncultured Caudovirales phage TaxID=2100421 RepID=A0A6J5KXI4_9CAUD|nr:hypothetical protein UFOVP53_189 [uncultured Caudovirales phage]
MKSQREATVNTILSVLEERGETFELGGSINVSDVLTAEDKKKVQTILAAGFNKGEIALSEDAKTKYVGNTSEMNKYVSGLINNWVRKFPDFNAGAKYEAKNPGSRQGTGDEQVREMKKLLTATSDEASKVLIQEAIDARLAEIKPVSKVTINVDALPDFLRHLVK